VHDAQGRVVDMVLEDLALAWSQRDAACSSIVVDFAAVDLGLYPIVTSQYSSTTLYQVSYHIQLK
jgi:hypothetical protein